MADITIRIESGKDKKGRRVTREMTDDEKDFGYNLEDESPWIVLFLVAILILAVFVELVCK